MVARVPAIMIPGTLCDQDVFRDMNDALELDAVCVPPIGQSTVDSAAEAILASAPDRFLAIGFSLGGFVALELLRSAPERLLGIVLIASNASPALGGQAAVRRAEVACAQQFGFDALIDQLWPSYVGTSFHSNAAARQRILAMAERVGVGRFAAQAEIAINRPDSRSSLLVAAIPILALCGDEDAINGTDRCCAMNEGPTVHLVELAGVGHFIPIEAPSLAAAAINDWVRGLAQCC